MDPIRRTRETYDQIAREFTARTALPWPELDRLMTAFLVRLPERPRLLDAGCGPGRDTRLLRGRGARVVGMDSSFGMLRSTSLSGAVQADVRAVPVCPRSVDGVWCQAALLQVPRADVPRVLTEFARVTRPAGALHLEVSEGDGESWEEPSYGAPRWEVHHREGPLRELLAAAGWHVVAVERMRTSRDWLIVLASRVSRR
jgi:ubiquinone/menaquinone biosynthesis C-methylase UbiE